MNFYKCCAQLKEHMSALNDFIQRCKLVQQELADSGVMNAKMNVTLDGISVSTSKIETNVYLYDSLAIKFKNTSPNSWSSNTFTQRYVYFVSHRESLIWPERDQKSTGFNFKVEYCDIPEDEYFQYSTAYDIVDRETCTSMLDNFFELDLGSGLLVLHPLFFETEIIDNIKHIYARYTDE